MAAGEGWSELRAELPRMAAELPPGLVSVDVPTAPDTHPGASATRATAPALGGDAALGRALAALWRDGAVVLRNAVSAAVCDGLLADMAPYLDAAGRHWSTDALVDSRRPDAVVARSAHSHPIVAHPAVLWLCEALLGRQALYLSPEHLLDRARPDPRDDHEPRLPWVLELAELIGVGSGSVAQELHFDGGYCGYDFHRLGVENKISTIWAVGSDFSDEIGATRCTCPFPTPLLSTSGLWALAEPRSAGCVWARTAGHASAARCLRTPCPP